MGALLSGKGFIAGAVTVVKAIKVCLERFRPQAVYMILGMMIGSLLSDHTGTDHIRDAESGHELSKYQVAPCLVGVALWQEYCKITADF